MNSFIPVWECGTALIRNKRFLLDEMTRRNASKFAIFYIYPKLLSRHKVVQNEKRKKEIWVFAYIRYGKFWSISLEHFIDIMHKPLFSEEWQAAFFNRACRLALGSHCCCCLIYYPICWPDWRLLNGCLLFCQMFVGGGVFDVGDNKRFSKECDHHHHLEVLWARN